MFLEVEDSEEHHASCPNRSKLQSAKREGVRKDYIPATRLSALLTSAQRSLLVRVDPLGDSNIQR